MAYKSIFFNPIQTGTVQLQKQRNREQHNCGGLLNQSRKNLLKITMNTNRSIGSYFASFFKLILIIFRHSFRSLCCFSINKSYFLAAVAQLKVAYCKEFAKLPCNFPNKRKLNARDKLSRYLPHTKDNVSLVMEFFKGLIKIRQIFGKE